MRFLNKDDDILKAQVSLPFTVYSLVSEGWELVIRQKKIVVIKTRSDKFMGSNFKTGPRKV